MPPVLWNNSPTILINQPPFFAQNNNNYQQVWCSLNLIGISGLVKAEIGILIANIISY